MNMQGVQKSLAEFLASMDIQAKQSWQQDDHIHLRIGQDIHLYLDDTTATLIIAAVKDAAPHGDEGAMIELMKQAYHQQHLPIDLQIGVQSYCKPLVACQIPLLGIHQSMIHEAVDALLAFMQRALEPENSHGGLI